MSLVDACICGDLDAIKILIQGTDIHDIYDYTLRMSVKYGHLLVVQYLVEHGANIHALDDYALRSSARNGIYQLCDTSLNMVLISILMIML